MNGGCFIVPGDDELESTYVGFRPLPADRVMIETVVVKVYDESQSRVQTRSHAGSGGESYIEIVISPK